MVQVFNMINKLIDSDKIVTKINEIREGSGTKIVMCHGVFDVFHVGHLEHFRVAKSYGNILIVSITSDEFVNKGPGRPIFSLSQRVRLIANLEIVDYVIVSNSQTAIENLEIVKPNFYLKGVEYVNFSKDVTGNIELEKIAVEKNGGEIKFTDAETYSSSSLINNELSNSKITSWIKTNIGELDISQRLNEIFEEISKLNVLVIGEAIIDAYVKSEPLGKTSKSHIVAFKNIASEIHLGGTLSVATKVEKFVKSVDLITGTNLSEYKVALSKINVIDKGRNLPNSIVKTRYIDHLSQAKIFETYSNDLLEFDENEREVLIQNISKAASKADIVIVVDYGHGLINDKEIKTITETAKYLCVNVQSNAGNRGFNTISKYKKADFVALNGDEVALNFRKKNIDYIRGAEDISRDLKSEVVLITNGKEGNIMYNSKINKGLVIPALETRIVDKVGAGDAVFFITSLFSKVGASLELTGLIGNMTGAISVENFGNNWSLRPEDLVKFAKSQFRY
jgi:rfaE bifunctional protein nucleotidyltransferase chain/domain